MDRSELIKIAKSQKYVLYAFLMNLVARIGVGVIPGLAAIGLIVLIVSAVLIALIMSDLAKALRKSHWLYLVLGLIPTLNLFAALFIVSKATTVLQQNGVRVGLMGAKESDIANLR